MLQKTIIEVQGSSSQEFEEEIIRESDLYIFDSLAEKLFGIKNLSDNIQQLKENNNASCTRVFKKSHI